MGKSLKDLKAFIHYAPTIEEAMQGARQPVGEMIFIPARAVPLKMRREANRIVFSASVQGYGKSVWHELFLPSANDDGCRYGCKVYFRQYGCTVRYAVLHSASYGHQAKLVGC